MSNRNEDRTLSGSTQIYADILDLPSTINAIRIRNNSGTAGQVLSKNPTTNKLEFASVPIADDTITTAMIQNLAVTDAKIANTTITGGKLSANVNGSFNIDTSGGIEANNITIDNDLVVNGNTNLNGIITLGNAVSDALFIKSTSVYQNAAGTTIGTIATSTGDLNFPIIRAPTAMIVGTTTSGAEGHTTTGGTMGIFAALQIHGEMSMTVGGSEVFDMNSHSITDCGGIAFTAGSDITNCDTITCNTLVLNTALNMDGIDLDLGSGDLDCNEINAIGTIRVDFGGVNKFTLNHTNGFLSCRGLATQAGNLTTANGTIDTGSGNITTTGILTGGSITSGSGKISTTGEMECGTIDAGTIEGPTNLSGVINVGSGVINTANNGELTGYSNLLNINFHSGIILSKAIDTRDSNITTGSGIITAGGLISTSTTGIKTAHPLLATGISGAQSVDIKGFNIYETLNDIPRILAHKSLNADHLITRSLNSYIALDSSNMLITFKVPPSLKIAVSFGFFCVCAERVISVKLLNSAGAEFSATYIDDTELSTPTTDTIFWGNGGQYEGQYLEGVFHFTFPANKRGTDVNLTPWVKASSTGATAVTGTTDLGGGAFTHRPPFYIKAESMGSTSAFGNTILLAGDDY